MATDDEREVYKQLHETCRHHYRLEWQLLQVGVIAAIGMLTFGFRNVNSDLRSWLFIGSGVALVWISYAMYRQSKGYLQANEHLVFYARLIGDPNVRKPGGGWKSAAVQGRVILFLLGAWLFLFRRLERHPSCRVDTTTYELYLAYNNHPYWFRHHILT